MADIIAAGFIVVRKMETLSETPSEKLLPDFGGRNYEFLMLKSRAHDEWGFPKGHKDGEERIADCAWRELKEETTLTDANVRLLAERPVRVEYDVTLEQEQGAKEVYYFLAELMDGEPVISREHSEFGFFSPAETFEIVLHENLQLLIRFVCQNHKSI
ncbi:MAG: NUDIX domain-containing protein [Planctomycetes bacterium]|nr:NUDIX domain-containing protein [Planctomycetota bacterium]